jgi:eukaryotic-like serine/threonine-protein kinase
VLGKRYQLGPRLGTGVNATVFEAVDLQLERPVAVKVLHPSALVEPTMVRRFRAAAQTLAGLSHPNIVAVYDFGQEDLRGVATPYLVMELLTGGSLRSLLDRGRTLTPSQALLVGLDACRGLDHAHRRGLIHGDVKPSNLLFGEDRRLRIADLALSRLISETNGQQVSSMDLAGARYVSPEEALGLGLTDRSDVYALALSLVESVTGIVPFAGDTTVATLANRIDKLLPVSADLGPLASVLDKAGRPSPAERSTAAEFGRALVQTAEKLPRPTPLPLVTGGPSLFEPQPGKETTSELTRFRDPTGAGLRPTEAVAVTDPTSPTEMVGSAGAAPSPRDPSGQVRRPPRSGDPTGPVARPRVVQLDETGGIRVDAVDDAPSRRKGALLVLLLVVGAVAAVVLGVIAFQRLTVPNYDVPALVGLDEGQAQNLIAGNGWDVEVRRERSDEQPQGAVFRTEPVEGESLKKGSTFVMYVSDGPTLSELPEITGLTIDQATIELTNVGLFLEVVENRPDETIPPGTIISWSVPEQPSLVVGDEVVKGTTIGLVVSAGPAPRVIEDYTGLTFEDVSARLAAAGLVVERAPDEFHPSFPAGVVIAQSVAPGESVERGSTVRVAVSLGPDLVTIPPLFGLDINQATTALQGAGLNVGVTSGNVLGGKVATSTVGGQPAIPGQQLARGAAIDLLFF